MLESTGRLMIYLERTPAPPLNACVRLLWYTAAPQVAHWRERILPSGCVQVILNLARDYVLEIPENAPARRLAPSLVVGARSVYEIVDCSDMADLVGITFEPGGFAPFAADSVDLFSNQNVPLQDVWGTMAEGLRDRLCQLPDPQAKLLCLEKFLLQKFGGHHRRNSMVEFALSRFGQVPAVCSVREVAKRTGWSERRFSQIFREEVGLAPKVWCRIRRFQWAVERLHAGADVPWAELALDGGFYDQSHFANEFRAFSGIDASSYSALRSRWANQIPAK
jgi:AraC-like DNA-binding protein